MAHSISAEIDNDGFLVNLHEWSERVAAELAVGEGITLTEDHWTIITATRQFYDQFELSPAMRPLIKFIKQQYPEQAQQIATSMHLMQLFGGRPAKTIAKIAGLPKPTNCL